MEERHIQNERNTSKEDLVAGALIWFYGFPLLWSPLFSTIDTFRLKLIELCNFVGFMVPMTEVNALNFIVVKLHLLRFLELKVIQF